MFGFVVNSVLGWFGYSTQSTEDIEHINANQDHFNKVEHHVVLAERFAKIMREEAYKLSSREFMPEKFRRLSTGMQGIFETYELMIAGLSVLFQQRASSLLLVDCGEVIKKVRGIHHLEQGRGNEVLMDPLNVWRAELS